MIIHSKDMSCGTQVLHCELQPQLPNKVGKLFGILVEGQHIIYVKDEDDGRPISSIFRIETMVFIAPRTTDWLYEVVETFDTTVVGPTWGHKVFIRSWHKDSSWVGRLDAPGLVMWSLSTAPCRFLRISHHAERSSNIYLNKLSILNSDGSE